MAASVKFDLWYFNTPEMDALIEHEGAIAAQGAMLQLFRYLRLCHNAIGNRRSLSKIARDSNCSEEWLWKIVTSYGLFIVEDDESFFSPYLSGLLHAASKRTSSHTGVRAQKRASAPYNRDNHHKEDNDDKKENKEKGGKVSDVIGPSAYETVDRAGLRHGHRGELVPWWASPQTDAATAADDRPGLHDEDRLGDTQRRRTTKHPRSWQTDITSYPRSNGS